MSLQNSNPTNTQAWQELEKHFSKVKDIPVLDLFNKNPNRVNEFSLLWEDFFIDFSKNRIDTEAKKLLLALAEELQLSAAIEKQFSGEKINETENRAVLHTALRAENKPDEVKENLAKMSVFSEAIITGKHTGYTGKPITHVVNIGIGGSSLGPEMVVEALTEYRNHLEVLFVDNLDRHQIENILKKLDPETTLFIVVSKSFSTQETLHNASIARDWFLEQAQQAEYLEKHFVAVSANTDKVAAFGISKANTFSMWDWVGGRFSLWSTVGLSIACAIGYENFENLLGGAQQMDKHFRETPFNNNIPVCLALISLWYNNFYKAETEAIIPYAASMHKLIPFLQQGSMESNGKGVDRNSNKISYQTGTVVWGEPGTNAQHAFFQLIHQGTKLIPCDFIGFKKPIHSYTEDHDLLMANFFAQTQALLVGKSKAEVLAEEKNLGEESPILPHKIFEGNKPTTSILIDKLTPNSLGKLIAMYEHKWFVQGVIWNIYSFDQWGVALGKQLAKNTFKAIVNKDVEEVKDASTKRLLKHYLS